MRKSQTQTNYMTSDTTKMIAMHYIHVCIMMYYVLQDTASVFSAKDRGDASLKQLGKQLAHVDGTRLQLVQQLSSCTRRGRRS